MSSARMWRGSFAVLLVVASGAIYACGRDAGNQPTQPSRSSSAAGTVETPATIGAIASNPTLRAKYLEARRVGKQRVAVHHLAMKDLRDNHKAWQASVKGAAKPSCAIAIALTAKYADRLAQGASLSKAEAQSMVSLGQRHAKGCESADPASLFSTSLPLARANTTWHAVGPYLYLYTDVVLSTINAWNGVADLPAAVDAAVQNMPYQYPLYDEDIEYLGALVEFAASSHDDAQEVAWTDNPNDTYEIGSLFTTAPWPWKTFLKRIAFVVISDVTAFGATFFTDNAGDGEEDGVADSIGMAAGAAITASGAAITDCLADQQPCEAIH